MRYGCDDVGEFRRLIQCIFLGNFGLQFIQIHILVLRVQANKFVDDLSDGGQLQFLFG